MRKTLKFAFLFCGAVFAGMFTACHSQVTPVSNAVKLSWQAPATCTTSCTYVVSRAPATGSTCPAATGSAYVPLNQGSPTPSLTYTDATAGGLTACFIAQTLLGNSVSVPSNTAGPFTIAPNALAPSTVTGTQTSASAHPLIPTEGPELAKDAPILRGMVTGQ